MRLRVRRFSTPARAKLVRVSASESLDEIHDPHAQRVRYDLQCLDRYVPLAAFDCAHVRSVEAGLICEEILRPTALLPHFADSRTEGLLDVLHQKNFKSSLRIRILLISRGGEFGRLAMKGTPIPMEWRN